MLRLVAASLFVLTLATWNYSQRLTPAPSPQAPLSQAHASTDAARGIAFYRQGNDQAAIQALRIATRSNRDDADAWHYLGLALNRTRETREARRAFERAVRLRPDFAAAHTGLAYTFLYENNLRGAEREARRAMQLDAQNAEAHYILGIVHFRLDRFVESAGQARMTLAIDSNFAAAHLLKSQALLASLAQAVSTSTVVVSDTELNEQQRVVNQQVYREAADSLERYISLVPNAGNITSLRQQLEAVRLYARVEGGTNTGRNIFRPSELTTRARIIDKPNPAYTDEARRSRVAGIVVLRALLSSDGTVRHIFPIRAIGYGLTDVSISAARRIRFEPASVNGRPVSTFVTLQYNFNIR